MTDGVTYDYSGNTGTFTIPDSTPATITYQTRVSGTAGQEVTFNNTAELGVYTGNGYEKLYETSVSNTKTITPAGTDTEGDDGVYTLNLYTYAENNMQTGLEGAVYRLLDSNQRPITYIRDNREEDVKFTTEEQSDGEVYAVIELQSFGMAIHKNTLYYLEMIKSPKPVEKDDGTYTYFQKDTTLYNFLISDNPNYTGTDSNGTKIYSYYNGDTLKVKCYTAEPGVRVKIRPAGNAASLNTKNSPYVLSVYNPESSIWDRQGVELVLQVYDTVENQWENVGLPRLYNRDNSWGEVTFPSQLTPSSKYRVIQLGDEPAGSGISHTAAWTVDSYYSDGSMQEMSGSEFTFDPDEAYSFNIVCVDEYVQHILTLVVVNEDTGERLKGATFSVKKAASSEIVRQLPPSDDDGFVIIGNSSSQSYENNTLYVVAQTGAAEGYIPSSDEVYFYFSDSTGWRPNAEDGLPSGASAIDLSQTYNTVTVYNPAVTVKVPVVVTWDLNGNSNWPMDNALVDHVVVGLYEEVDGRTTPVIHEGGPWTVSLDQDAAYDNTP